MIRIINNKTQIPMIERIVACVGDNDTQTRQFQLPRYLEDIDLSTYVPRIEIQPIDTTQDAYFDVLNMFFDDTTITLTWTIKSHNTVDSGILYFDIYFGFAETDNIKVYQTLKDYFEVKESINATQQSADIPPTIFEQAVIEATYQADLAKQYRDEIIDKSGNLEDLATEQKLDLVSAINELVGRIGILEETVNSLLIPENYQVLIVPKE